MSPLIRRRQLLAAADDPWVWLRQAGDGLPPAGTALLLPWASWLGDSAILHAKGYRVAPWLPPEADMEAVALLWERVADLPLVGIHFPQFTDGRGYTLARELRRLGFRGELRALGQVLRDQLFFLEQCGFDAFALDPGEDPRAALAGFAAYSTPQRRRPAPGAQE